MNPRKTNNILSMTQAEADALARKSFDLSETGRWTSTSTPSTPEPITIPKAAANLSRRPKRR